MSIIDRFLERENQLPADWKVLEQADQIETIRAISQERPVAIFKHSVRCGISAMAKHQLESDWDFSPDELTFYYLDLIRRRPLSNQIAETFGVTHQSPQLIVISRGEVVYHTSHHMVSSQTLRKTLHSLSEEK